MPSESEMLDDLAAADAAGDIPTAQHIAGLIKASRQAPAPTVGRAEALLRGSAQGATMGWGDEAEARWKSLFPKTLGGGDYKETRDQLRKDEANARSQHPGWYTGGEVGGSILPAVAATLATGGAAAPAGLRLALAAGQGAAQGAGYSDAGDARTLARDTLLGAGLGTAGFGAGEALGAAGRGVARFARARTTAATAKAGEQAAQEVADAIHGGKSALGAEVQKGSRYVENLMRLEGSMTPEQKALYAGLHPEVQQLQQRVAQSTLEALPDQASTIAGKDAELAALKSGASQAFQNRKAELLKPQILEDVGSLAKSYGEPLAAAALAPPGMKTAAGIIFGRTRAGKAIASRVSRPGNQIALMKALETVTDKPGELLQRLLQGGAAPLTQTLNEPSP